MLGHLLLAHAHDCLAASPFPGRAAAIARRVVDLALLSGPTGAPPLTDCVALLIALERAAGAPLLDALARGDDQATWRVALALAGLADVPAPPPELAAPQSAAPAVQLGQLWRDQGRHVALPLVTYLHQTGQLDQAAFRRLLLVLPESLGRLDQALQGRAHPWSQPVELIAAPLRSELTRLIDAAVWPLVSDLRPETWPALRQLAALRGGRFLLRILEEIEHMGLARLSPRASGLGGSGAV